MERLRLEEFKSSSNLYLVPDRLESESDRIISAWESQNLSSHIFILSSGTTSTNKLKSFALSKSAFLKNAEAVNRFLNSNHKDIWLTSLPIFHVGGLAIYARAFESGAKLIEYNEKWHPDDFIYQIKQNKITLCSLVPTQLYDLVKNNLKPNAELRGVFIGGDFASTELLNKAYHLGWPIIETFGMSELSSQIASSFYKPGRRWLEILDIHEISQKQEQSFITSESLYTAKIEISTDKISVEKALSPFLIPDTIEINGREINVLGRRDDCFKISGRLFYLKEIREELENFTLKHDIYQHVCMRLIDDERQGKKLEFLLSNEVKHHSELIKNFIVNKLNIADSFHEINYLDEIPRTDLGKLKQNF